VRVFFDQQAEFEAEATPQEDEGNERILGQYDCFLMTPIESAEI
jgi:hypothetical protein